MGAMNGTIHLLWRIIRCRDKTSATGSMTGTLTVAQTSGSDEVDKEAEIMKKFKYNNCINIDHKCSIVYFFHMSTGLMTLISGFIYRCPCPVWGVGSYIYLDIYFILHGKPFLRTEVP